MLDIISSNEQFDVDVCRLAHRITQGVDAHNNGSYEIAMTHFLVAYNEICRIEYDPTQLTYEQRQRLGHVHERWLSFRQLVQDRYVR